MGPTGNVFGLGPYIFFMRSTNRSRNAPPTLRWDPGLAEMEVGTCSFSLRMWRTVPKRQKHRSSQIVFCKKFTFWDPVRPIVRLTASHLKLCFKVVFSNAPKFDLNLKTEKLFYRKFENILNSIYIMYII